MNKISNLITELSKEAKIVKPLYKPAKMIVCLLVTLLLYAIILQTIFGIRLDIVTQLSRPLFVTEILSLFALLVTSLIAVVITMYPDFYQKSRWLKIPYAILLLVLVILISQLFMSDDPRMMLPKECHKIECAIGILFLSLVPAIIIFAILKKGATIIPIQSGLFAVLAAVSLGSIISRLYEANDSISHMLIWHSLPILFFTILGGVVGKYLLKW